MRALMTIVPTALALVLLSGQASAEVEPSEGDAVGRLTLSAAPLYAYVVLGNNEEPSGAGAALVGRYGLTRAIALQLTTLWTNHDVPATDEGDGGTLHMIAVAFGGAYALDLLVFTPMIELGVSLLHRRLNDAVATDLGLLAGISANYWLLDWLSLGFGLRYHAFVTDLQRFPVFVDLGPNVAIRW